MDAGEHKVFGVEGKFDSPLTIAVPTIADALKEQTQGKAKVVSVSMKDRAAIPGGGRSPDLTAWFEGKANGFTMSDFYASDVPDWIKNWNAANRFEDRLQPWTPESPNTLQEVLGDDEKPGEGATFGWGATFPHDPSTSEDPAYVFHLTPNSTRYLLDFARAAVDEYALGRDDVPDLLAVSISAVDYAGHSYGPDSWEYLDTLIQADAELGKFISELNQKVDLRVLITADHGVGAYPDVTGKGGRIFAPEFAALLNAKLKKKINIKDPIEAYSSPYFYLRAMPDKDRQRVIDESIEILNAMPSIRAAYDVSKLENAKEIDDDALAQSVQKSLFKGRGGEIIVMPDEHYVIDEVAPADCGTSHGSPWSYDQFVPVAVFGDGIPHLESNDPIDMIAVTPTIAALLGIQAPAQATTTALIQTTP
ncbi:MAG: alkaline phosphatase family protein [Polyangiales bacterium]